MWFAAVELNLNQDSKDTVLSSPMKAPSGHLSGIVKVMEQRRAFETHLAHWEIQKMLDTEFSFAFISVISII